MQLSQEALDRPAVCKLIPTENPANKTPVYMCTEILDKHQAVLPYQLISLTCQQDLLSLSPRSSYFLQENHQ